MGMAEAPTYWALYGATCPMCETGIISLEKEIITSRYKDEPQLSTLDPIWMPTCLNCKEQFIDREVAQAMDTALERAYVAKKEHEAKKGKK